MTHPFHRRCGDIGRYSGAATIPQTGCRAVPAAALVVHLARPVQIDPMFRQLDVQRGDRPIREIRLAPIVVCDFYARA